MFNKLKQLKDLRDQAKVMQSALSQESVTVEKGGITITMDGNMEVKSFLVADGLKKETIESKAKEAINECIKKIQRIMAKKMQDMGGFPGLK